ncbi:hypothetical protein EB810_00550 [Altererythrobacter sp. FM1]|uniref:hypothetical protein n=1 Tax=Tsuneonella flava TaxID=2055955 RepID=UPI000C80ECFA|nr:hypothetical protein [Tsuneonella flava]ROT96492.1 hypothetical protein EB810_00550 [Altererythrobacter sp. FM1]
MKRLVKIAVLSSAFVGAQLIGTAAMAQSAPNGVLNGFVVATKGITLNCELVLTLDAGANEGSIAMNPGDANCAALNFNGMPYDTSYSSGVLTFHDVDVTTITLGDCAGDISGTWDGTTLLIDDILPAKTAGADCTVEGFAS